MRIIRLIYNIAFPFVLIGMLPGFLYRMLRRGNYRHKFGQRFAIYSKEVRAKAAAREWTWIHAVSVGEVLIALKVDQLDETRRSGIELRVFDDDLDRLHTGKQGKRRLAGTHL